ncbi:MAG TPA: SAM-dependent methyltransferase [Burkholderiaceae bacterium]|nr:SAM-dependent methyltransferase [Burkholderiaceae bacterium]
MAIARLELPRPTAEQSAISARLRALIAAEVEAGGGWIAFDRYMDRVLYAPGLGYYAAGATKFGNAGSGGDFVTAPEISPLFAQALSAQVAQIFRDGPCRILEFGAGSGRLAADLLAALRARGSECEQYLIVEVSAELQQRQRARLGSESAVRWLTAPPQGFEGVMLANEVLDVMPVRMFVKRGGAVLERGVTLRGEAFVYSEREATAELLDAVTEIESELGALPDGYASEVGLAARAWTRSAAGWLGRGVVLLIDYGFPRREYYHPQRLMGTLMCHYRHHAHVDPFWLPGCNDLTAHVDFTAIADAGHGAGLQVLGFTTQAHFLLNCGLTDRLHDGPAPQQASAVHRLVSEAEMGELFKVLALGKDVDGPLIGFARGDRTTRL